MNVASRVEHDQIYIERIVVFTWPVFTQESNNCQDVLLTPIWTPFSNTSVYISMVSLIYHPIVLMLNTRNCMTGIVGYNIWGCPQNVNIVLLKNCVSTNCSQQVVSMCRMVPLTLSWCRTFVYLWSGVPSLKAGNLRITLNPK